MATSPDQVGGKGAEQVREERPHWTELARHKPWTLRGTGFLTAPLSEHPDNDLGWLSSTPTSAAYWHYPPTPNVQSTGQMESLYPTSRAGGG